MAALPDNWVDGGPPAHASDFNEHAKRINKSAFIFVQTANPETTNPEMTGPAIWYVTDGGGNITDVRVRT